MMNYRVIGERLLVELILETKQGFKKEEEWKNIVTVLGVGDLLQDRYNVGEKLLVSGTIQLQDEHYVIPQQIFRKIDL